MNQLQNHCCPKCQRNYGIEWDYETRSQITVFCSTCRRDFVAKKYEPTWPLTLENADK